MAIGGTTETAIMVLIFNATAWANYADNAATTPQTQVAFALHTADPGTAGTQTTSEVAYTSYARTNVNRSGAALPVTGTGPASCSPAAAVSFAQGTGGAGTATYFSAGKTGGGATAILFSGTVTPNITCGNLITPQLSTATAMTLS
jgi:hypothetical protein